MNKLAIFVVVLLAIGGYFYRDQIMPSEVKARSSQTIYTWKDSSGKTHYGSDKSAMPASAKVADLPEISILETDRAELEKHAARLKEKEKPQESGEIEKPKMPQVRNLALERMEKSVENLKK